MKKLYAILIACAMTISLGACSGGSPASQSEPAPSSSQTVSSQAAEPSSSAAPAQPESSSAAASSETPSSSSESASNQPTDEQVSSAASEPAPVRSEAEPAPESSETEPAEQETGKALVVYFSWSGNTESVAREIQSQTGADSFEIVPAPPYTDDYDALLDLAQEEQSSGARPAISGSVDLSGYDTIYLGYPNWWGDMPMIIYSFLDDYDLSGKTVAPFCTSGGSGLSGSVGAIRSAEPNATVLDGLHIGSDSASNPASAVAPWLAGHGQ